MSVLVDAMTNTHSLIPSKANRKDTLKCWVTVKQGVNIKAQHGAVHRTCSTAQHSMCPVQGRLISHNT